MNYLNVSATLRNHKMYVFSIEDVRNLFPDEKLKTIKNNFLRWISKGYFVRLKRGLYEIIDKGMNLKIPDLFIANRLYEPSYVSLETALSFYSIIPDIAAGVTSVTLRPTRTFKNNYGSFFYRTCQERAFRGYRLMLYEGFKVSIADKEKALVDFLYYRMRSGRHPDFKEERLNKHILKKLNWQKVLYYAGLFNPKTLKLLKECREYAKC